MQDCCTLPWQGPCLQYTAHLVTVKYVRHATQVLLMERPCTSMHGPRGPHAHVHEMCREILLQQALDCHICVPPDAAVHLPIAADANPGSQLYLLRLDLPLVQLCLCTVDGLIMQRRLWDC